MKNNSIKIKSLFTLLFFSAATVFTACKKDSGGSPSSAHVRIVNAFEGSASQDLYLDNVKINGSAIAYAQNTDYVSAVAGNHNAKFANSGSTTANVSFSLALQASNYYTVYYTSNDTTKSAVITHDRITSAVSDKAKVRFVLLSSAAASAVDFGISNTTKLVTNLAYKVVSDYYTVDANTTFSLYAAGSQNVLLSIPSSLQAGKIYTIYISGSTALHLTSHVIVEN